MASLRHAAPATVEGACSLLEEHGDDAAVLSGGQSLLPALRQRDLACDVLVDINDIDGRSYIEREDGELRVGCLARHADVAASDLVAETVPALAAAAASIGDIQVRNRGTLCGAIAQAAPRGDPPTLVSLLDTAVVATSTDGDRILDGRSFYGGEGTELEDAELVSEVRFEIPGAGAGTAYEKWTPAEGSYPVAAVGALVELDDGAVTDARLVTGALEGAPTGMSRAAELLVGEAPTEERRAEAARTLGDDAEPAPDFEGSAEFKRELATTLAKDALDSAVERAREGV